MKMKTGLLVVLGVLGIGGVALAAGKRDALDRGLAALQADDHAGLDAAGIELAKDNHPAAGSLRLIAAAIRADWQSYPVRVSPTKYDPSSSRSTSIWAQTVALDALRQPLGEYAKRLESMGLPGTAAYLRQAASNPAGAAAGSPVVVQAEQVPPASTAGVSNTMVESIVAAAVATGNPAVMRATAQTLRTGGYAAAAASLEAEAARIEAALAAVQQTAASKPPPAPVQSSPVPAMDYQTPAPLPALAAPPVPTVDLGQDDPQSPLHALVRRLSTHLNLLIEARKGVAGAKGREDKALVREVQQALGLRGDGMYGPKTGQLMAAYYGDVPIVFYWPKGTLPNTEVPKHRAALLAEAERAHAAGYFKRQVLLKLSAAREKGQGYGTALAKPVPVPSTLATADKWLADRQKALSDATALSEGRVLSGTTALEQIFSENPTRNV